MGGGQESNSPDFSIAPPLIRKLRIRVLMLFPMCSDLAAEWEKKKKKKRGKKRAKLVLIHLGQSPLQGRSVGNPEFERNPSQVAGIEQKSAS